MRVGRYLNIGVLLMGALAINFMLLPALKAEEVKLSGGVDVGFGLLDQESAGGFKKLESAGTARIKASTTIGEFEAEAEIGFIDDAGVDYTEHAVHWNASETAKVTLSGSAFGLPGVDGFLGVIAGEGTKTLGDLDVYFDYSDAGLFNINVEIGALILGLGISDTCVPECGTDGGVGGNGADEERNTFIFTVRSKPGGLRYQVYAVSSTGTYTANLQEGKGSGFGLSLGIVEEAFEILGDLSIGTSKCVPALGCSSDVDSTNFGVAFKAKGFGAQIVILEAKGDASKEETMGIDLVYHLKSGKVTYGPQYSQVVIDNGGGEVTDSFMYFAISLEF